MILVVVGVVGSLIGAAGLVLAGHRSADGAFVADLAPVHTDGYAIAVPDVSAVVSGHGTSRLLASGWLPGDARLMLVVRADEPILVALAPSFEANRYLAGVRRTEVIAAGFATGAQPVETRDLPGAGPPSALPRTPPWDVVGPDRPVELALPLDEPMALVLMRTDGSPGFVATVTAGIRPSSWGPTTLVPLIVGGLFLAAGILLGYRRRNDRDGATGDQLEEAWTAQLFVDAAISGRPAPGDRPAQSPYVHTAT